MVQVLRGHAVKVYEVNRPDRSQRRQQGKSDPLDAENAARAVLAGRATAIPKEQSGVAEALPIASVARRSAVKSKTQAINQLWPLLVSAPDDIRTRLWRSKPEACIAACTRLRSLGKTPHLQVLTSTLRALAKRWRCLAEEIVEHDKELEILTKQYAKRLRKQFGVGPQTSATLLSVCRGRQSRTSEKRSSINGVMRGKSVASIVWEDHPTPSQSKGQSSGQQCIVDHCHGTNAQ